jgi:sigma-B regulation protein RsbU (phosphoserine phosphatase)
VSAHTRYRSAVHVLADGDLLFAFTDGITEAADAAGQLFGEERLAAVLLQAQAQMEVGAGAPVRELVDKVIVAVRQFAGNAPQADDIAALALMPFARPAAGKSPLQVDVRLEIAACIESMVEVSAAVDELAAQHVLPAACRNNMQIVLDEVLSNIVHHAPADAGSEISRDGNGAATLRIRLTVGPEAFGAEIEDDGPPFDPTRPLPPMVAGTLAERPVGGLGLHLMQRLCTSLDYCREGGTNRLCLGISRAEPPAPSH